MLGGEVIEDEGHRALEGERGEVWSGGDYQEGGGSEKTGCAIAAQPVS